VDIKLRTIPSQTKAYKKEKVDSAWVLREGEMVERRMKGGCGWVSRSARPEYKVKPQH
jgi:hypothetical protein